MRYALMMQQASGDWATIEHGQPLDVAIAALKRLSAGELKALVDNHLSGMLAARIAAELDYEDAAARVTQIVSAAEMRRATAGAVAVPFDEQEGE